jgi:heme-degrading monooxygenase HmoA
MTVMKAEPVVLINAFEVLPEKDEAFLSGWERAQEFLSSQDGYLSTTLHRSITQTADFRYVNVALWRTPQAFQAATSKPEFRAIAAPFTFHASLYEVARQDQP